MERLNTLSNIIHKIEWHCFDGADASMIEKSDLLKSTYGAEKFDYIIGNVSEM